MGSDVAEHTEVIIVGAGPVGLCAAARLSKLGVSSVVLEKRDALGTASKASTFHPPTLEMFREFGIIDAVLEKGLRADRIQYRMSSGAVAAEFDHAILSDVTDYPFRLHLEQSEITPLLARAIRPEGRADLRFGCEVETLSQSDGSVRIGYRDGAGISHDIEGQFVLAADGAHSRVRDLLGIALEGSEYPGRVLRLIAKDRLERIFPGLGQISYVFDDAGKSISLLQMPDIWRVIIRLPEGSDPDTVVRPDWYMPIVHRFMPGAPDELDLLGTDIYGARKMLSQDWGRGRAFLIGDALHLTNTRGGMNMNCGIHDAYAVTGAIARALHQGDPALAVAAAKQRHKIALTELLPRTDGNVRAGLERVAQMRETAASPEAARQMLLRTTMLDMAPPRDGSVAAAVLQEVSE